MTRDPIPHSAIIRPILVLLHRICCSRFPKWKATDFELGLQSVPGPHIDPSAAKVSQSPSLRGSASFPIWPHSQGIKVYHRDIVKRMMLDTAVRLVILIEKIMRPRNTGVLMKDALKPLRSLCPHALLT